MPRRWFGALLAAAALSLPAAARAQQDRAGAEFRANTYVTGAQERPEVVYKSGGDFTILWHGYHPQDGSGTGVMAQRYDAAGNAGGGEFRVNSFTASYQYRPRTAADNKGNFVVIWSSYGEDGAYYGVFGKRFDPAGNARGGAFQVNTYTPGGQGSSFYYLVQNQDVAMAASGFFVVVWGSYGADQDGSLSSVHGQRYDPDGNRLGGEFRINTYTTGQQTSPAVGMAANGNFVVAWAQFDGDRFGITGQRFDPSGSRVGAEFRVNANTTGNQVTPSIQVRDDGSFVVAWADVPGRIFARTFAADTTPGTQFQVNTYTTGYQYTYSLAQDRQGNFIVAWNGSQGDNSADAVFARRFLANGTPRGAEFRVNGYTTGNQNSVDVASDDVGNVVVAWRDAARDGSGSGVFAQRFGGLHPTAVGVNTAGNLVWEPGESVDVRPTWRNYSGATRTFSAALTSLTGPAGATYTITDGSADYGTVTNNTTSTCSSCYVVMVSNPATRPVTHWDAIANEAIIPDSQGQQKGWRLHIGNSFNDVPSSSTFYRFIEILLHNGITSGCNATSYCPSFVTTRDQMSVFVLVAKEGAGYQPRACTTPVFPDVPASNGFCRYIEELARRGVVSGCGGGNYCPSDPVTREQMAVFVLRTLDPTLNPPACVTPMFNDVPASSPFCKWIEELARRGVVTGCGGGNYCPAASVTREQMGVFISVTFALTLYGL